MPWERWQDPLMVGKLWSPAHIVSYIDHFNFHTLRGFRNNGITWLRSKLLSSHTWDSGHGVPLCQDISSVSTPSDQPQCPTATDVPRVLAPVPSTKNVFFLTWIPTKRTNIWIFEYPGPAALCISSKTSRSNKLTAVHASGRQGKIRRLDRDIDSGGRGRWRKV